MKDWFYGLEDRERLFVGIGVIIVALALIYGFVWARKSVREHRSAITWCTTVTHHHRRPDTPQPGTGTIPQTQPTDLEQRYSRRI
jgi:hypothetical protein